MQGLAVLQMLAGSLQRRQLPLARLPLLALRRTHGDIQLLQSPFHDAQVVQNHLRLEQVDVAARVHVAQGMGNVRPPELPHNQD